MGETHSDESQRMNLTPSIALQDTILRIRSELLEISPDIFKMHFSPDITPPGTVYSTRCIPLTNFCEAINEIFSSAVRYVNVFLLENTEKILGERIIVPIVLIGTRAHGVDSQEFSQVLTFDVNEPYGITISLLGLDDISTTVRISSSDFRVLISSLFEDAVTLRELAKYEVTESRSLIDETQSRSLAEIPMQMTEGGELLNGNYTDLKRIGEGHNGIVWKAREPKMGRDVAIKMLRPEVLDIKGLKNFYAEVLNHGTLNPSPNIVQIYTIHDVTRPPFYVMEFVEGNSLEVILRDDSSLKKWPTNDQSMQILLGILRGLSHAHNKGVLHGDIKPANIMIDTSGVAKLSDFGCAKRLSSDPEYALGEFAYTSLQASETYSAPELLKGDDLESDDFSSDMFSFGLVMYLLLGKAHPFLNPSGLSQIRELIKNDDYQAPSLRNYNQEISDEIVGIVASLLDKDQKKRP